MLKLKRNRMPYGLIVHIALKLIRELQLGNLCLRCRRNMMNPFLIMFI